MYKKNVVSVIIPALDEALAIAQVLDDLFAVKNIGGENVMDHIIVCDNGSKDNTAEIAKKHGASVVHEPIPGYGRACLTAISKLPKETDIVLFVDGDQSCKAEQSLLLLESITSGCDLAIGSRVLGKIEKGALTPVQQFGNWLSAKLIFLLWRKKITDLGPFRAIKKQALTTLNMQDKAFGWTVEMQVKAIQQDMLIKEYAVDSTVRIGKSKISGTIKGSVLAGIGILSKIAGLYLTQYTRAKPKQSQQKEAR